MRRWTLDRYRLMSETVIDLSAQAREMVRAAEERGDFLFLTTFKRYQVQLRILADLERKISVGEGSPEDITAYNRTAAAANKTAATLRSLDRPKEQPEGGIVGRWETRRKR